MNNRKVILVTGSNRSGSTWVGRVIAANSQVDNIVEPLNLNRIRRFGQYEINAWYPRLTSKTDPALLREIHSLYTDYIGASYLGAFRDFLRPYEGSGVLLSFKKRLRRASKPIKMLKDPTALFVTSWLEREFEAKPVVLIRHPAAYALSIKEKMWWFDFDELLTQPDFFSDGLEGLQDEVLSYQLNKRKKNIIENAALMWKIFYTQVLLYQQEHPFWYFVRHEDISRDPQIEFQKIFTYLDLDFNGEVQEYIAKTTKAKSSEQGQFVRDSQKNAEKWKSNLSKEEIDLVRSITCEVAMHFYPDFTS